MLDNNWLEILCCPETHQKVVLASEKNLHQINELVALGQLKSRAGTVITDFMEGLLVREDAQFGYPIRSGIPVMLMNEAIPLPRELASA